MVFLILAGCAELGSFSGEMRLHGPIGMGLHECDDVRSLVRIDFNLNRLMGTSLPETFRPWLADSAFSA